MSRGLEAHKCVPSPCAYLHRLNFWPFFVFNQCGKAPWPGKVIPYVPQPDLSPPLVLPRPHPLHCFAVPPPTSPTALIRFTGGNTPTATQDQSTTPSVIPSSLKKTPPPPPNAPSLPSTPPLNPNPKLVGMHINLFHRICNFLSTNSISYNYIFNI